MNVLYFAPIRLYPKGHGNIATVHQFIARLHSLGHSVHYVLLNEAYQNAADLFCSQIYVDTLDVIEYKAHPRRGFRGYYLFDSWYFDGLGEHIRELCNRYHADVIICTYIFQSKILEFIPDGIAKIIDTHDRMTDRHLFLLSNNVKDEFFSCTREDEANYLSRADIIWARRDEETAYFNEITKSSKTITVSHFDPPSFLSSEKSRTYKAGFLASDNQVNYAMVKKFLAAFAKKYTEQPLDIEIVIGGNVKKFFEKSKEGAFPNTIPVKFSGFVPDFKEFYQTLDLVLVPIEFGTGINVKMIEAMSFGMPILSTQCGIKGIKSNTPWHHAETIEELIESLGKIWHDDAELKQLAEISQKYYMDFYTKNSRSFDSCFDNLKNNSIKKNYNTRG